jgi:NAD(P)-dependent dehydrogenase (short-subunit alcohol dehydrogenase family)
MTVVVTGANRGIGYAVAAQLVNAGAAVTVVVRDPTQGERTRSALAGGGNQVSLVVGDLSTVDGIRSAAEAVREACPHIDALVHNAGIWPSRRLLTDDGLEQSFVTNHLAPFLLNHALEPVLLASGSRVVQVSAGLYVKGRVDIDRTPHGLDFHPLWTYADTKLCNLLMLPRFAERWAGTPVTINAVHPGVIRTGLGDRRGPLGAVLRLVKRRFDDAALGARPVVRLARDPELAGRSGEYYHVDTPQPLTGPATQADLGEALWTQALSLTGLAPTTGARLPR